jgi:hypothetical protein
LPECGRTLSKSEQSRSGHRGDVGFPSDVYYEIPAPVAKRKMKTATIHGVIEAPAGDNPSNADMNRLSGQAAMDCLPEIDTDKALAEAAMRLLSPGQIMAAPLEAASGLPDLPDEEIDEVLSTAANEALRVINDQDHHDIMDADAFETIELGLAVHGHGRRVKAIFGPRGPSAEAEPT